MEAEGSSESCVNVYLTTPRRIRRRHSSQSQTKKPKIAHAASASQLVNRTTVYYENRMKHTNTQCGQNREIFNVKVSGALSNSPSLKG